MKPDKRAFEERIEAVLHGLGIPWMVVCDDTTLNVETNRSNHIFHQIEHAGVDLLELKLSVERAGNRGLVDFDAANSRESPSQPDGTVAR